MSASRKHPQSQSPRGIWNSLNRFVFTLLVLTVAAVIGYNWLPESAKRREAKKQVEELKSEVEKQEQKLARAQREADALQRDPNYVALIARDRLDLVQPGEKIYRLDPPKPDASKMRRVP